jgi:hypothetical protein
MVEINKVLLDIVDTLEKIADSLTKFVSVVNLSWCKEAMGNFSLGLSESLGISCFNKEENKWENFWFLYSLQ